MALTMKLELIAVPVSDVARAKAFYEKVGFRTDIDTRVSPKLRFIQMTPPGSACSIAIGDGIGTDMQPGDVKGLQLVVENARLARGELARRGVEVSDVDVQPWGSFVFFDDPDGNGWTLQELPKRG